MSLDIDNSRRTAEISDAATVFVARDTNTPSAEVLLLQRRSKSRFLPDAYVFPGGRRDVSDSSPYWDAVPIPTDEITTPADYVTAARELFEEAGIWLNEEHQDRFCEVRHAYMKKDICFSEVCEALGRPRLDLLEPFAIWITPVVEKWRYRTVFFSLNAFPNPVEITIDRSELKNARWSKPKEALKQNEQADIFLAPPTLRTLEIFAQKHDLGALRYRNKKGSTPPILPEYHARTDQIVLPGDPLHSETERAVALATRFRRAVCHGQQTKNWITQAVKE